MYAADTVVHSKLLKYLSHLTHFLQALNLLEQEHPDYDMDDEDERWVTQQQEKLSARSGHDSAVILTHAKFEEMMDRLEKGSGHQVLQVHLPCNGSPRVVSFPLISFLLPLLSPILGPRLQYYS